MRIAGFIANTSNILWFSKLSHCQEVSGHPPTGVAEATNTYFYRLGVD
jgi:hypothetical protein